MLTKFCIHCNCDHPIEDMVKDASGKDGYKRQCKACLRKLNTARIDQDRDRHNATRREKKRTDPRIIMVQGARTRAKKHGLPCDILVEDLYVPTHCPALGIPLVVNVGRVGYDSPTLDKIVPSLGYVKGNVVVVSHLANRIKSNATNEQLRQVADYYSKAKRLSLLTN